MLEVEALGAGYGGVPVVRDFSMRVAPGEVLALFGHNGAGKSTLLKVLFGLHPGTSGSVRLRGKEVLGLRSPELTRLGVSLVPQGRGVFPALRVGENLEMGLWAAGVEPASPEGESRLEQVFVRLPVLRERWLMRAGTLSGGQQQMVSIGRALLARPALLLLDEPSVGLAPKLVEEVLRLVRRLRDESGIAVVLVEQNVRQALAVADRVCVMKAGRLLLETRPDALGDAQDLWALF